MKPKTIIKKTYKRLRKEFRYLFPIRIEFFFEGREDLFVGILFGGEGILAPTYNRLSSVEYVGKYKSFEGVLGELENNRFFRKKCSKIQIRVRSLGKIPFYTFSSYEEFKNWLRAQHKEKLIFKVSENIRRKLEEICKEDKIRKSDLLRSMVTYWLWQTGK